MAHKILRLVIAILICEVLLRVLGWNPITPPSEKMVKDRMAELDELLGWRSLRDVHTVHSISGAKYTSRVDGARITSKEPISSPKSLIILGCSFTNGGVGLNDEDTYPWKIQESNKTLAVHNFGTSAYGTIQSLLFLRNLLDDPRYNSPPFTVVYGFVSFHEARNVAHPIWLKGLTDNASQRIWMPYGRISNEDTLIIEPRDEWVRFPLRSISSVVALLEEIYGLIVRRDREAQQVEVTLDAIEEMRMLVEKKGGRFLVAHLYDVPNREGVYDDLFKTRRIPVVNCLYPGDMYQNSLKFDGHPNDKVHSYWAQCISDALKN